MLRFALAFLLFGCAGPALAQSDPPNCDGFEIDQSPKGATLAIVAGEGKAHFVKNPRDASTCPADGSACEQAAFLLAGDKVVVTRDMGAFACVDFVGGKGSGRETSGWFPKARLTPVPVAKPDWVGTWRRDTSAAVKVQARGRSLALHGDATWGEGEGTNIGAFDGTADPSKADAAFTVGADGMLPFDKGDEYDCRVQLKQLGPYLLVQDNPNCGGANVRFTGVYVRR